MYIHLDGDRWTRRVRSEMMREKKIFQSDFLLQDVNGSSMSGFFHIIEYDE